MTHKQATAAARGMYCLYCGDSPCEPCHYPKHRGMGGKGAGWEPWEWVPLCRIHHDVLDARNGASTSATALTQTVRDLVARRRYGQFP